jgi:cyclohexanecarboxylate-CoA ligase
MLGAVLNPFLTIYREHEVRHIVGTCESTVLIVPEAHRGFTGYLALAETLQKDVESVRAILVVRGSDDALPAGCTSFARALEAAPVTSVTPVDPDEPALVTFTSGTEGMAKGCVHSSNTLMFCHDTACAELGLSSDDIIFMASPLGHATGLAFGLRLALRLGATLVLQDQWDPAVACRMIAAHGCTITLSATPFVRDMVDHMAGGGSEDFRRFRMFVSGGAPIPRELVTEAKDALHGELLACYGQAETYMVSLVRPDDPLELKSSCDGTVLPGVEVRVVDPEGNDVAVGEPGECWTRGPHVMLGYLNPPPGHEYEPGGWLSMGDLVCVDEGQRLAVVGRKKEIIIRGGINISPREVEEILLQHPAVDKVAVVGFDDRRLGERACAIVVPAGEPPTLEDVTSFLRDRGLAAYKLPERVEVRDELPMTASGKVQKVVLRTWLAEKIEAEA